MSFPCKLSRLKPSPSACRSFESDILAVPQDETLEEFAALLGAQKISTLVREHYLKTGVPDNSAACHKLAKGELIPSALSV